MRSLNSAYGVAACTLLLYCIFNELDTRPSTESSSFSPNPLPRTSLARSLSLKQATQRTDTLLMFNALPKCGSRTLLTLVKMNDGYSEGRITVNSNLTNIPRETVFNEESAKNFLSKNLRNIPVTKPSFVYTHARFVDLSEHIGRPVKYISVIREPFSRLVSGYYYRRHRDKTDLTDKEKQWRSTLTDLSIETYDQCVRLNRSECTGKFTAMSTIAHFCGSNPKCSTNVTWALQKAKWNVVHYFDVVGIMEDYTSFVEVAECMFPSLLNGARQKYRGLQKQTANMKTQGKVYPSNETRRLMTEKLQPDNDFYNFVKYRFYEQKRKSCSG